MNNFSLKWFTVGETELDKLRGDIRTSEAQVSLLVKQHPYAKAAQCIEALGEQAGEQTDSAGQASTPHTFFPLLEPGKNNEPIDNIQELQQAPCVSYKRFFDKVIQETGNEKSRYEDARTLAEYCLHLRSHAKTSGSCTMRQSTRVVSSNG